MWSDSGYIIFLLLLVPYIESGKLAYVKNPFAVCNSEVTNPRIR